MTDTNDYQPPLAKKIKITRDNLSTVLSNLGFICVSDFSLQEAKEKEKEKEKEIETEKDVPVQTDVSLEKKQSIASPPLAPPPAPYLTHHEELVQFHTSICDDINKTKTHSDFLHYVSHLSKLRGPNNRNDFLAYSYLRDMRERKKIEEREKKEAKCKALVADQNVQIDTTVLPDACGVTDDAKTEWKELDDRLARDWTLLLHFPSILTPQDLRDAEIEKLQKAGTYEEYVFMDGCCMVDDCKGGSSTSSMFRPVPWTMPEGCSLQIR